jgi:two-component system, chemotaxis family, chemotaxis protein CheY
MKKILIVDDSLFMRNWLKKILGDRNNGIIFFEAENGFIALQVYKQNSPNLVLMDITMPNLNGLEVLKEILKFDSKANIVMCSSLGQKSFIIDSIKIGAKDFIVKPNFTNLISTVNKYL